MCTTENKHVATLVTQLTITWQSIAVSCPYCQESNDGWSHDPRGTTVECEFCDKEFVIDRKAQLVIKS